MNLVKNNLVSIAINLRPGLRLLFTPPWALTPEFGVRAFHGVRVKARRAANSAW